MSKILKLLVSVFSVSRNKNMNAGLTGSLWVGGNFPFVANLADSARDIDNFFKVNTLGIEINHQPIRLIQMADARIPRVNLDTPQLRHVQKCIQITSNDPAQIRIVRL